MKIDTENPTDPLDFEHLTDEQLDQYLGRFCLEITDIDIEELKPTRNAIDELRKRYRNS